MPMLSKVLEGMQIVMKHQGDGYHTSAEHDVFYCGDKPEPDSEDGKRLLELGWLWDEEVDSWFVFT